MSTLSPLAFGKVAVLLGGDSAEREVSLNSGKLVLASLQAQGVDAHAFDPAYRPLTELRTQGFDRIFNILHGGNGENGTLQGALEYLGMPYTGSRVLASALSMDKLRSKQIWAQAGISTPEFDIVLRGENDAARAQSLIEKLGLPLFVKPACEGSSVAIAKAHDAQALIQAIDEAHKHDPVALIERSIEGGGEYTVALVEGLDLPVIRIVPAGEFYDYHAKYVANDTQYFIPSGLNADDEQVAKVLAKKAFLLLGCSGWGRVDAMTDALGKLYFLEANTAPGMTDHSLVPKAARAAGVSYDALIWRILEQTLEQASRK